MARPDKNITAVSNPEPITGGTERESNDDFYDRIAAEYENSMTYLGNDSDYIRWAKQAGAGDCIVVSVAEGPGTVKLVLVDSAVPSSPITASSTALYSIAGPVSVAGVQKITPVTSSVPAVPITCTFPYALLG